MRIGYGRSAFLSGWQRRHDRLRHVVAVHVLPSGKGFLRGDRPRPEAVELLNDDMRVSAEPESLPGTQSRLTVWQPCR